MDPHVEQMLQMMAQPVFFVKNDTVCWHNEAARYLVCCGQNILTVLDRSAGLYELWNRQGPMQIELSLFGVSYRARVRNVEDGEIFVLEKHGENFWEKADSLMYTSAHLRRILQELLSSGTAILDQMADMGQVPPESEIMNRSIYRLIRLCTQLSYGGKLLQNKAGEYFERINVRDFLDRFAEEAGDLLKESSWRLEYTPCGRSVTGPIDRELVERALYNLLSNGIQRSAPGSTVWLKAWEDDLQICFSVSYTPVQTEQGTFFPSDGISPEGSWKCEGVGIDLVRLIAEIHGGTVLFTESEEKRESRMIFSVRKHNARFGLRSNRALVEEFSGFHHGLVELSEVLDQKLYHPDRV